MTPPETSGGPRQQPIAVVGVSALMPGSADTDGFWRTVVRGHDLVTDVPPTHWLRSDYFDPDPAAPDKTYGYRGAFLDPVDFDPLAHGLPPSTLPATDTSQTLTLLTAQRLLDDLARYGPPTYDRERVSVILGTGPLELLTTMANRMQRPVWAKALREGGLPGDRVEALCDRIAEHYVPWQEASLPGLLSNVVAGRVANRFDFHGTNFVTDAACAGSLAAVSSAVNELRLQQADMVITGGVDTLNDIVWYTCFSKTPALSPTGDCRPFSADSDGMVLGEGIVLFALKRLVDAERDGDAVYAVIRGVGTSSDGRGTAVYTPLPEGQVRALRRAYQAAGYPPGTVELVEAHGTGTRAGDAAETAALRQVFGEASPSPVPWCALGSLKSQFGHTKATAGAAGLLKAVLAVHHGVLPPTIKVTRPNPRLGLTGSPFEVNTATRPWIRGSAHPRRASVSSFGFGGTNFHVTVEEYVPRHGGRRAYRTRTAPSELVVLTATSPEELLDRCRAVAEDLRPLSRIARESQEEFLPGPGGVPGRRLAIVATGIDELRRQAEHAAARVRSAPGTPFDTPDGTHYGTGPADPGRLAFLCPGQGSQYVGMGTDVALHVPRARLLWDRLADIEMGDRPLHRIVFPAPAFGDEERDAQAGQLTATEWAQPAVAAHSAALLAVLHAVGIRPDCVAGHSLGELTALHAAGVMDDESLVRLARRRGELMRDAAREPGGMLAVPASAPVVENAIRALGVRDLWPANHNAPEQVVVSGGRRSLTALERRLAERGIRARPLNVSAAFHSPLVQDMARPWGEHVRHLPFTAPEFPVYANSDATAYPSAPGKIAERIARQPVSVVRFADQVRAMYADGVRTFVEVGPGSVLTGLVRANLGHRDHAAIALDERGKNSLTALHDGLARLVARGVPVRFAPLWEGHAPESPPAPPKSSATVRICGTNYGKPYPVADPEVSPVMPQPVNGPTGRPEDDSTDGRAAWWETVLEVHRLAAATQASYQRTTAESHLAYLSAVGRSLNHEDGPPPPADHEPAGPATGREVPANGVSPNGIPASATPVALPMEPPPGPAGRPFTADFAEFGAGGADDDHQPVWSSGRSAGPADAAEPDRDPAPVPEARAAERTEPARQPDVPADDAEAGGGDAATERLIGLTLEVVADKTGYPVDILRPEMHLQADLGVDSIKRVEVLSALRDRVEGLPTLDPAELGRLQTIGEIAERLTAEVGG
ncbi:beta-ketoacyl synthase N-terminal-like domain-containing protein [Amycolatopsis sp. NPDC051045]|uniref:beta-ketoacyl synthase N-terminal-like domain-containing protein n=1 Tax=Amycolatopsis sp. NPDC051045 TaxID=3156922 RepID=UPI0034250050